MSTSHEQPAPDQAGEPTVSTAPSGGETTTPPSTRWWRWGSLPDHLGRARTSTVILSVLFLAIFTLYLNVRPPVGTDAPRQPAGGDSDVDAPVVPGLPTETTEEPEPTEEPAPTTAPEETGDPDADTDTPTTGSTPGTSSPGTTEPTTEPTEAPETSDPTGGTTGSGTSGPATSG